MAFLRVTQWLVVLTLLTVSSAAGAQTPQADAQRVEVEFDRGVAAADGGDWAAAEGAFAQVCEWAPTANALLNLATARYHLQKLVSALQALDLVVTLPSASAAERATAARMRERVAGMLARLAVHVDPPSASVALDGVVLPQAQRQVPLDPGTHQLDASADGYRAQTHSIEVEPGEHQSVHLVLVEAPVEPAAAIEPLPVSAASPVVTSASAAERVDAPSRKSRKRWLWALGAVVVAAGAAVAVAVPLANREPGCSSASVSLGGCAP